MVKAAIRFCGGCNPAYDRVEYSKLVKEAAGGGIEWVAADAGDFDVALLICGCERACAEDRIAGAGARVVIVKDPRIEPHRIAEILMT